MVTFKHEDYIFEKSPWLLCCLLFIKLWETEIAYAAAKRKVARWYKTIALKERGHAFCADMAILGAGSGTFLTTPGPPL